MDTQYAHTHTEMNLEVGEMLDLGAPKEINRLLDPSLWSRMKKKREYARGEADVVCV